MLLVFKCRYNWGLLTTKGEFNVRAVWRNDYLFEEVNDEMKCPKVEHVDVYLRLKVRPEGRGGY